MDKRTLFFVLALSLTLFFVNMFFERQNQESLHKWSEQQVVKRGEKLKKLKLEVEKRTESSSALPLAKLYADSEGKEPLSSGIISGQSLLTLAWSDHLPQKAYAKSLSDSDKLFEVSLASNSPSIGAPVIYRHDSKDTMQIGSLPEFGKYDLQIVIPEFSDQSQPIQHYLGQYSDGHVEIPIQQISILQKELFPENNFDLPSSKNAIVLLKMIDGYRPVALYSPNEKLLEPLDAFSDLSSLITKPKLKSAVPSNQKGEEKFYVLETPYQQLVFSNFGGALAEINLPFKTKTDESSVVKEIEFDREMVQKHPYNARFPAHGYFTSEGDSTSGFTEHAQGKLGGYYPLLRRDLIQKNKSQSIHIKPRYYALNIVSEYPETAELIYEVKTLGKDKIVFETIQGHRRITKSYSLANEVQAPYCLDLTIQIEGESRGLWITSGIPEVEWISGAPAPSLKYRITRNQKVDVENIDLPQDSTTVTSIYPDWVCNSNGFLGMILDPLTEIDPGYRAQTISGNVVPSRLVEIDQEYQRFQPQSMPGYMLMLPLKSTSGTMNFRIFAGPFAGSVLKAIDKVYEDTSTGYNPDYIACQSFHGWFSFISEPFAKFLFILMDFFHSITNSWAFSIILLTVALRIMLYPLNAWSTKSMLRMQQIAPEVTAIQEKYKKDPKKAQLEVMNLYREKGVNPVSGCFPMLIQMPFLIGMFDLLKSTFELRGASFIPGWIDNLTAPDVLFSWSRPIFFIGNQFHLLPILLGLVMFFQQRMMSSLPKDPSLLTEQQKQQKFMGNIMTVVFAVMFYNFPSGLNIYWLSSMLLGILQQYWTTKQMKSNMTKIQAGQKQNSLKTKK